MCSAREMPKASLRSAALVCLGIWAAVWLLFLLLRFSSLDVRYIPGAPALLLGALAASFLAPVVALGFAAAALVRQPRVLPNLLTLAGAGAALLVQALVFASSRWM